jgi:hypothetical protein
MTKQIINVGSAEQSGDGESIRSAFIKVNHNFDELYQVNAAAQGTQGIQGRQGLQGRQGTSGSQGLQGRQGIQGIAGGQGSQGIQGIAGSQGITGSQGIQGIGGAELVVAESAPSVQYNKQWFNSQEGRLYVNYNSTWVDASPTQPDASAVRFNELNQIELPQGGMISEDNGIVLSTTLRTWTFGTDGNLTFPDESMQSTAYRYIVGSSTPSISAGALWFNSDEGRLYINYNNTWLEASPTQLDPTAVRFDSESNITFPDGSVAARFNAQESAPTIEAGALWFNSAEGRLYINYNNTWLEASPTQLDPTAVRFDVDGNLIFPDDSVAAKFDTDGNLTFPDSSVQSTAYRYAASTSAPIKTQGALWFNSDEGKLYINYNNNWLEASPTQLDPSALRADVDGVVEMPSGLSIIPAGLYLPGPGSIVTQAPGQPLILAANGPDASSAFGWYEIPFGPGSVASISFNENIGKVQVTTGSYSTTIYNWVFSDTGDLLIPGGKDIKDAVSGHSVLNTATTGNITFSGSTASSSTNSNIVLATNSKNFTFGSDGSTTFPNGAKLNNGTSYQFATDNSVVTSLDLRDTSGRGFYTNGSGFSLRGNGDHTWTFGTDGNLTLPAGGEIHSSAGTGNVSVQSNDGSNNFNWDFNTHGSINLPGLLSGAQGYGSLDANNNKIALTSGDTVNFGGFSGMILVNTHNGGGVSLYLCGGGTGDAVAIGSSKAGNAVGSMAFNAGISGYTFTADETGDHVFCAIRTRTGG